MVGSPNGIHNIIGMPVSWSQIRQIRAKSGTATAAGLDYPLLLPSFPLVIYQEFQYNYYLLVLNKNACAISFLRKLGPGVTYVTNATSKQTKHGLRLPAHARYAFSQIWNGGIWDHHTGIMYELK